jgi:parallel beta-helix repeat protein
MKKISVITILVILFVIGGFILFLIFQEQKDQKVTPIITLHNETTLATYFNEQDYPEILAQIIQARAEIVRATQIIKNRNSNINLDDCQDNVCFIDTFQISQDNSHLDCQGKIIKPKKNDTYFGLIITAKNTSVINCGFESFKTAIKIQGSENIITNNSITNNPENGIVIEGSHNFVFNNNMRDNKRASVHVEATSKQNIIYNNTMIDTGIYQPYTNGLGAISISGSENIILENNIKNNPEESICIQIYSKTASAPSKNLVARNNIENSGVLAIGITGAVTGSLGSQGQPESPISEGQNIIFNNTLAKSKNEFGLRMRWSNNNKIIGNIIRENNWSGISTMAIERNLFEKNIISNNKREGIWLGSSNSNEFWDNIIVNNTEHCAIVFTEWLNDTSTNNTFKNNLIAGNGNMHDDKQICDEDHNLISENEFR